MESIPESDPLLMRLQLAWPVETRQRHRAIIAVSGGPDSMALLHLLTRQKSASSEILAVVHVDHSLRDAESARDAEHVRAQCQVLGVDHREIKLEHSSVHESEGEGLEGRARQLRYEALKQAARESGARYIVTGHHRDDQVETILHRIVRGTGIRGLMAMRPFREIDSGLTLARPLLHASRAEIEQFVQRHQIPTVKDSSNEQNTFTRNRIRNELVPWLNENINASVDEAILRLSELATEYESYVERSAESLKEECILNEAHDAVSLDVNVLRAADAVVVKSFLRLIWREKGWPEQAMSQPKWNLLSGLILDKREDMPVEHTLPGNISVKLNEGAIQIWRIGETAD